jgi:hypothetical protein
MKSLILLLIASLLLISCTSKKAVKSEPKGKSTLIGIIAMVNPEQNYVLIHCEQMPAITAGTNLTALSADGKKTQLILTPERKGHYLTADIKEGTPEVSNLVLFSHGSLPNPEAPVPAVTPSMPNTGRSPTMNMPTLPDIPLSLLDPALNQNRPANEVRPTTTAPTEPQKLDDLEPVVNGDSPPNLHAH